MPISPAEPPPRRSRPDLRRSKRVRYGSRLVTLLPPLVFLVAAGLYCVRLGHILNANLPAVVAREAGTYLHRQVRLSAIRITPLSITLTRLAVSNKQTWAASHGESLASADRVVVHYSLRRLIADSKNAATAFGDVDLTRPTALVEVLPGKQFNFSDLLVKKKKPAQKPYDGRILVDDGFVTLRDYTAPADAGLRPAVNHLGKINALVDLHSERFVYFHGTAQGNGARIADVAAAGDVSRTVAGRFRVEAHVSDADAAYWSSYFKALPNFRVLSGRAKADITVSRLTSKPAPGLPLDLFGLVTVRSGAVALTDPRVRRLPLQAINGNATFTGASVVVSGTALAGGQPFRFAGTLADFLDPQLAFTGSAQNVDALRLASYFPQLNLPPGLSASSVSARIRVTGSSKDPVWGVDASAPALRYRGAVAGNVQARAVYAGGILSFSNVAFNAAGGTGSLRATVNTLALPFPTLALGGRIDNVTVARLPLPQTSGKLLELGGTADTAFFVTGTTKEPSLVANIHVLDPKVAQTAFRSLKGRIAWQLGHPLIVRRAVLDDGRGGAATASGTVPLPGMSPGTGWNLGVSASGVDIHALLAPYLKTGAFRTSVGGLAYAQARVTGPLLHPVAGGDVQIYGGRVNTITTDAVTGHVVTDGEAMRLSAVTVRRYPTEARVDGTLRALRSGNPFLNLSASVAQADVTDLLGVARQAAGKGPLDALPTLTGTASARLQIGGRALTPRIAGHTEIADATVGAYRFRQATADAAFDGQTVRVTQVLVQEETGATLAGRGQWNPKTGRIAALLNAQDVSLSLLHPYTSPYADLRGTVDAALAARGTVQSPVADVRVTGRGLSVDGQTLQPLVLTGEYAGGAFTKSGAPWLFTVQPSSGGPVSYSVDALRVALPTPQQPKRPISFAVRAHLPEDAPERIPHLLDTLRASRFARAPAVRSLLTQVDSLPSPPTGTFWIGALTARGPLDAPTVSADVQARDLVLGSDNLNTLSASLSFAGGNDPSAQVDLSAKGLRAADVAIDTITAKGSYDHRTVVVDALDARSQAAYLHGSGRAELDGVTDASLDVSDVPLSLFNPFLGHLSGPRRTLSGTVSALTVQASGKTRAPEFVGSLSLDKPALDTAAAVPDAAGTHFVLDSIRSGAVTLAAPKPGTQTRVLTVTDLTAFKAGKTIASLSGSVPLALGSGNAMAALPAGEPLTATAQIADLSALAGLAPGAIDPARTGGSLRAAVSVDNGGHMTGTAEVQNGTLGFAGFDTALTGIRALAVLDGTRMKVQNFVMSSTRGGQIVVTGGGTMGEKGQAALQIAANKFVVEEGGRTSFLARTYGSGGRGTIDGAVGVFGPWLSPRVATAAGEQIVVSGGNVSLPTTSPPATGTKTAAFIDPNFDVNILLGGEKGGTVSARSSLLRADARGDLHVGGDLNAPVLRAHLTVARGQFFLPPSTTLKVVRSTGGEDNTVDLRFDPSAPVIGPDGTAQPGLETRVDLTAQANVTVSDTAQAQSGSVLGSGVGGVGAPTSAGVATRQASTSGAGRGQRYTITAHITGLLNVPDKLSIELSSSPIGLSRSQMLAALVQEDAYGSLLAGGQGAEGAFKTQVSAALYSAGISSVLFPLETTVINTFGLSDFSVDYSPDAPTLVTLSKELAPRLLATYTRLLGARASGPISTSAAQPQYTLKLGYGLAGHLQVSVSTDDQRNNTLALEGIFGF